MLSITALDLTVLVKFSCTNPSDINITRNFSRFTFKPV